MKEANQSGTRSRRDAVLLNEARIQAFVPQRAIAGDHCSTVNRIGWIKMLFPT